MKKLFFFSFPSAKYLRRSQSYEKLSTKTCDQRNRPGDPRAASAMNACIFLSFSCLFRKYSISLQHRYWALRGEAGGLILWERRFRTSVVVNRESRKFLATADRWQRASTLSVSIYLFIYSSFWRGLTALSILCGKAMREPTIPGWAKKQTPTPFLYHKLNLKQMFNC